LLIQTEPTPNPATLKFLPGREVLPAGTLELTDAAAAERASPLATRIFTVEGVRAVYLATDFISVTKDDGVDWYALKPAVLGAVMEHYLSGEPVLHADHVPEAGPAIDTGDPIVMRILELLDARVRPAVARDGGDITFQGFERGVVYLNMRGACSGCPSSTLTLKAGIENLLKYYVPEVVEVRAVA
jgi:Fe-S cluster biogenesis protein NfuA